MNFTHKKFYHSNSHVYVEGPGPSPSPARTKTTASTRANSNPSRRTATDDYGFSGEPCSPFFYDGRKLREDAESLIIWTRQLGAPIEAAQWKPLQDRAAKLKGDIDAAVATGRWESWTTSKLLDFIFSKKERTSDISTDITASARRMLGI
jgi:hypothetical protein